MTDNRTLSVARDRIAHSMLGTLWREQEGRFLPTYNEGIRHPTPPTTLAA